MRKQPVMLHSKQKGTIGEISVIKSLLKKGYSVFTEVGDLSRVDLIAIVENVPIKIQVKSTSVDNGAVEIYTRKSGPGYSYRYTEQDVDIFAIYIENKDIVLYIAAKELLKNERSLKLRFDAPKNGQKAKIRDAWKYSTFEDALRDHTPSILPKKEDDDMIQTTKGEILAGESQCGR